MTRKGEKAERTQQGQEEIVVLSWSLDDEKEPSFVWDTWRKCFQAETVAYPKAMQRSPPVR